MNRIGLTILVSLALAGCSGEPGQADILPLAFETPEGEEFIGGSYDPSTGRVQLTQLVAEGLERSAEETSYAIGLQVSEEAPVLIELPFTSSELAIELSAETLVDLVATKDGEQPLLVGDLTIKDQDWIGSIDEADAETSFAVLKNPSAEEAVGGRHWIPLPGGRWHYLCSNPLFECRFPAWESLSGRQ